MTPRRILFIQSTIDNPQTVPYWGYFRAEPAVSWVAAAITEPEWEHQVLDADQAIDDDSVLRQILSYAPDVIGFSCYTAGFPRALRLAKKVKEQNATIFCIFGGWHPSLVPDMVLAEPAVDAVGVGQGERFINILLRNIESFRGRVMRAEAYDPLFVFREKSFQFRIGTLSSGLKAVIYLLIILGLFSVPIYNLSKGQMILQNPAWVNSSLLLIAVLLIFYLTAPVFRIAYRSMRLSPLEFLDDFRDSQEGQYLPQALAFRTSNEMRSKVHELWAGQASVEYLRHQACLYVKSGVQEIRMFIIWALLTTFPIMTLSFAIISLTGQRLSAWQIIKGGKSDESTVVLGSLLEHLYFCVSVFSTLGIGDTRPLIDEWGFGEAFVISMLTMFMITGLVVSHDAIDPKRNRM
ncbi:MAG: cobalamin-dependent protein [Acidobacteriota bacterium]